MVDCLFCVIIETGYPMVALRPHANTIIMERSSSGTGTTELHTTAGIMMMVQESFMAKDQSQTQWTVQ